jgi:5-methyltetrahydrofolate--homocysteine methyltransferase
LSDSLKGGRAKMSNTAMTPIEELLTSTSQDPIEQLKRAIVSYDVSLATSAATRIAQEDIDPLDALDAMTAAIRLVGEGFGSGDLFLPDLIGAADAMSAASPIIQEAITQTGGQRRSLGIVVLGTVFGDIHSIGKSMVQSLLTAEGFTVHDLGVDVSSDRFVEAVREHRADLLAMSALLTTTAPEMRMVIAQIRAGPDLRDTTQVIVGGAAVSQAFADSIGADGYDSTAVGAAKLARNLVNQ